MPYRRGGSYNRGGGGRSKSGVRLTGLFETKRKGLFIGSAGPEQLDALIALIKTVKADPDAVLTFFLWENDEGKAVFSLNADKGEAMKGRSSRGGSDPRRRRITEDPEPESSDNDDDPFGDP
jgi:hypothetical protein